MMKRWNRTAGTTLVEVLVVMVVFLIGILAILQTFPGGLRILRNTRDESVAASLARSESERLKGRPDRLPEMILPVNYVWSASGIAIVADSARREGDLGPVAAAIDSDGQVLDGDGNALGHWSYLSGPNVVRRVIGEGGRVPAPRPVGSLYGGLMVLQFAPVVFSPQYTEFFQVYGPDLSKREGEPSFRPRDYEYFVDEWDSESATLYVPRDTVKPRTYRLAFTAWIRDSSGVRARDIVDVNVGPVAPDSGGGFVSFPFSDFAGLQSGESLVAVEWDTIRLSRLFDRVGAFSGDPYEYQLLDTTLGVLLFNPAAYNATVRVGRGRVVPLTARVNYDVLDWRILREEFRVPPANEPWHKLVVGSLAVQGMSGADGRPNPGFPVPFGNAVENRDFGLVDLETGGTVHPDSYTVDKSLGLVTFRDKDGDPGNGIQIDLMLPGAAGPTTVDGSGRALRALYQASGQWAVQALTAPAVFRQSWDRPGVAQFYVGGSSGFGGLPTRIYFPWMDAGKKVQIGEIVYRRAGDATGRVLEGLDFLIQGAPADRLGLPYVDIRSVDPEAVGFDFATYGYAVRRVKGASVSVRVLWNPAAFTLGPNVADNLDAFNRWLGNWRVVKTDTFLQRSGD